MSIRPLRDLGGRIYTRLALQSLSHYRVPSSNPVTDSHPVINGYGRSNARGFGTFGWAGRALEGSRNVGHTAADTRIYSPFIPGSRRGVPKTLPCSLLTGHRGFAKRLKKWEGVPWRDVLATPGEPVPPSRPNAGSVRNRKRKRKVKVRVAFTVSQVKLKVQEKRAAIAKRDAERIKRWKEGFKRAQEWKELLASRQEASGASVSA